MGVGQRVVLGGGSTLRFSSLAALTPFVFLVGRPGFLLERFYRHDRHSKGTCFRTYVGEYARVKRRQLRKNKYEEYDGSDTNAARRLYLRATGTTSKLAGVR